MPYSAKWLWTLFTNTHMLTQEHTQTHTHTRTQTDIHTHTQRQTRTIRYSETTQSITLTKIVRCTRDCAELLGCNILMDPCRSIIGGPDPCDPCRVVAYAVSPVQLSMKCAMSIPTSVFIDLFVFVYLFTEYYRYRYRSRRVRCVEQVYSSGNQDTQAGYDAAGGVPERGRYHEEITSPEACRPIRSLLPGGATSYHHWTDEWRLATQLSAQRQETNRYLEQSHWRRCPGNLLRL